LRTICAEIRQRFAIAPARSSDRRVRARETALTGVAGSRRPVLDRAVDPGVRYVSLFDTQPQCPEIP